MSIKIDDYKIGKYVVTVSILAILLFCQSCMIEELNKSFTGEEHLTYDNIETKWAIQINKKCNHSYPCTIKIKDFTTFSWDKMIIVIGYMNSEELNKILDAPFPDEDGMPRKIIFLKDKTIVYSENPPTSIEKIIPGEMIFDSEGTITIPYRIYTPDTAIFKVKEENSGEGVYYNLTQTKE